ncbi:MAG: DUF2127 domain-containing protein [Gemmatimonadetes bacterium]|nr:DUF2127 domain-containing protein [Gemmatimonadota bacterium]
MDGAANVAPTSWSHRLFRWAVILKGIDGLLEVGGGVLLFLLGPHGVSGVVAFLTQHELAEDPGDLVAGFLVRHTRHLGLATIHFAAVYLLVHGITKVGLVVGLLRERRGVFPVAIGFLGLFLAYQVYRMLVGPSPALAVLIVVDTMILALIWKEYAATAPPG